MMQSCCPHACVICGSHEIVVDFNGRPYCVEHAESGHEFFLGLIHVEYMRKVEGGL